MSANALVRKRDAEEEVATSHRVVRLPPSRNEVGPKRLRRASSPLSRRACRRPCASWDGVLFGATDLRSDEDGGDDEDAEHDREVRHGCAAAPFAWVVGSIHTYVALRSTARRNVVARVWSPTWNRKRSSRRPVRSKRISRPVTMLWKTISRKSVRSRRPSAKTSHEPSRWTRKTEAYAFRHRNEFV